MASSQSNPPRATPEGGRPVPRLAMKPVGATGGHVDGGWWPRSNEPVAEFPALLAALDPWVGPVSRVSYHLDRWADVERKVPIDGRAVRFEGFHSMDRDTVVVIGADSRRVNLLVVPPGTPGGMARAALRSAAEHDSTARVADILVGSSTSNTPAIQDKQGSVRHD